MLGELKHEIRKIESRNGWNGCSVVTVTLKTTTTTTTTIIIIIIIMIIQLNLPKTDPLYTGNLDKRKINFGTELFPM